MICGMHNKLVARALLTVSSGVLCVTVHADGGRLRAVVEGSPLSPRQVISILQTATALRRSQRDGHAREECIQVHVAVCGRCSRR